MKKLFIYYSLSGNGDLVAERLSKLGYDPRKVKTKKKNFTIRRVMLLTGSLNR